jgi:hypothetical protein
MNLATRAQRANIAADSRQMFHEFNFEI